MMVMAAEVADEGSAFNGLRPPRTTVTTLASKFNVAGEEGHFLP